MSEEWKWWVGSEEDRFHTECDTREEAEQIAREEYDGAWIIEAVKTTSIKLSDYFDVNNFIENANDAAYDLCDPDGDCNVFDTKADAERDLQEMVRAAIDTWQEKHSLKFVSWSFAASRNREYIPALTEDPALPPRVEA